MFEIVAMCAIFLKGRHAVRWCLPVVHVCMSATTLNMPNLISLFLFIVAVPSLVAAQHQNKQGNKNNSVSLCRPTNSEQPTAGLLRLYFDKQIILMGVIIN